MWSTRFLRTTPAQSAHHAMFGPHSMHGSTPAPQESKQAISENISSLALLIPVPRPRKTCRGVPNACSAVSCGSIMLLTSFLPVFIVPTNLSNYANNCRNTALRNRTLDSPRSRLRCNLCDMYTRGRCCPARDWLEDQVAPEHGLPGRHCLYGCRFLHKHRRCCLLRNHAHSDSVNS